MSGFVLQITDGLLPESFKNKIVPNMLRGTDDGKVLIRSDIKTFDDINTWIKEFGDKSATQWNVRSSNPIGVNIVCSKKFVCHHSSFMKVPIGDNKRGVSKNANCRASILVQIKKNTKNVRYKDPYSKLDIKRKQEFYKKEGFFGVIVMEVQHTHSLNTAESFRFLTADINVRNSFIEHFNDGMGITEAHKYHEKKLELLSEDFEKDLANGSVNPTIRTIQWWHDQWRLLNLGPRTGEGLIEKLAEKQTIYKEHGSTLLFNEKPFAVVIITPLMKRVHGLSSSKNIVFMDSTSACDSENHVVTFMLTTCAAGAVPLAIIISRGQTYECYRAGFQLIEKAVPNCFNGQKYPLLFLTDQSTAEIKAIHNVWPKSRTLLCIFHVLQAVWRWLWDQKHNIIKNDRPILMKNFQEILYSNSEKDAEAKFKRALEKSKYQNWTEYVKDYWTYKEEWCLAFRDHLTRGHNTNNYSEITVRIFKDNVLCRVRAYNVIALVDLTCTALEKYYTNRLREFANGRNSSARLFLNKLMSKTVCYKKEDIIQSTLHEYLVPSQKNKAEVYFVNVHDGFCSCPSGQLGRFCKHQCAIFKLLDVHFQNFPPVNVDDKYEIAKLALGERAPSRSFYEPFMPTNLPSFSKTSIDAADNAKLADVDANTQTIPTVSELPTTIHTLDGERESVDEQIRNLCDELIKTHKKYGSSTSGIANFRKRLAKISSTGQWETFLHTAGSSIPLRKRVGAAIRVQPTSIARRRPQITRGSKRLPSGRPSIGEKIIKKRPRNFQLNVNLNRPNAKCHGKNH